MNAKISLSFFAAVLGLQAQAGLPFLTQPEIQQMRLLRLWHTVPVVENADIGLFMDKDGELLYIPEQIQDRRAVFKYRKPGVRPKAKEVACESDILDLKNQNKPLTPALQGIIRMSGETYAKSTEPDLSSLRSQWENPKRYALGTSIQAGQDFSVGGWIRFARPEIERDIYKDAKELEFDRFRNAATVSRDRMKGFIPNYYSLISKVPDPLEKNMGPDYYPDKSRDYYPEWEIYLTNETIYLGAYQGSAPSGFFGTNMAINAYEPYRECIERRRQYYAAPAIPLKKGSKPGPLPPIITPPPVCELPPIIVRPPMDDQRGQVKTYFGTFNSKSFEYASTWSSVYRVNPYASMAGVVESEPDHFEAWHFFNINYQLSDPLSPSMEMTLISFPYYDKAKNPPRNVLERCIAEISKSNGRPLLTSGSQCTVMTRRVELTYGNIKNLMNESESPVLLGFGKLGYDTQSLQRDDRIYRSGTYMARAALDDQQVLRMAQVLYPAAGANCLAKDLKTLVPGPSDFRNEKMAP